jgi:NADH-ubiquinone oxidoreductase chain 5
LYRDYLGLITGLVVLAGMTKRAQIPFSAWLPAAMAAPTPVSALVHSSTLVTAGVYLLIRFNEILGVNYVLFFLSVLTILIRGVGANFEIDLKKIIALSTLSQLGVMIISLSLGMVELAYFHLLTHALFKSLLFLCAGVFIHGSDDTQDIRLMGVVGAVSPLSALFFVGRSIALCGFPFMSGFYSKDLILELVGGLELNLLIWVLLILATFMTIMYSVRLFAFMMVKPTTSRIVGGFIESWSILAPIRVLFFLSVVGGSTMGWEMAPAVLVVLPSWLRGLILGFMLLFTVAVLIRSLRERIRGEGTTMVRGASLVSFWGSIW